MGRDGSLKIKPLYGVEEKKKIKKLKNKNQPRPGSVPQEQSNKEYLVAVERDSGGAECRMWVAAHWGGKTLIRPQQKRHKLLLYITEEKRTDTGSTLKKSQE